MSSTPAEHRSAAAVVRRARSSEGASLWVIAAQAYRKYRGMLDEPPAPVLLDYDAVASTSEILVHEEHGALLGMVTIERPAGDPHLVLRNLAVLPSAQGRGIGTGLARAVEAQARAGGWAGVRLWTRVEMTESVAFYERLGYTPTHSEVTPSSRRVFFVKQLRGGTP